MLGRDGHPNPVPRVAGKIGRKHPGEVEDVKFLRVHSDRWIKMTVPGPFIMTQQAQNDFYERPMGKGLRSASSVISWAMRSSISHLTPRALGSSHRLRISWGSSSRSYSSPHGTRS